MIFVHVVVSSSPRFVLGAWSSLTFDGDMVCGGIFLLFFRV